MNAAVLSTTVYGPQWLDDADAGTLRAMVINRARGSRDGAQYFRAGVEAHGMRLEPDAIDAAVSEAALILIGWRRNGLPETLALHVAAIPTEDESGEPRPMADIVRQTRGLILGSAARDGLRKITQSHKRTALAAATARRAAALTVDPRPMSDPDRTPSEDVRPGPTSFVTLGSTAKRTGAAILRAVGGSEPDEFARAILATDPAHFPALWAWITGPADPSVPTSVAHVARVLFLSDDRTACRKATRALQREHAALAILRTPSVVDVET